jgi:hypothetical protein
MNSPAATSSLPAVPAAGGSNAPATRALIVGLVGLGIALVGLFLGVSNHDNRPLVGWLIGFGFWFSMCVGMLYLVILFYLFDAGWSIIVRRQLEHALAAFPILVLCFLPLLLIAVGAFGSGPGGPEGLLWKWLDPTQNIPGGAPIANNPDFIHKAGFLSLGFFVVRLAIYASVFCGLARLFRKHSFAMDTDPRPEHVVACRKHAAWGVYAVSMATTFAAFDLFMSLSFTWFSTMYGVWFFATSMRAGLAGTVIMCYLLSCKEGRPLYGIYNRAHRYLLGCLCLTFTIFWAYVTFSQYFLIYHANVPEETFWFNLRELNAQWTHSSWWWVSLALIFGYFFLPFFALLSYYNKVRRRGLVLICCWILSFQLLDLYFNILPAAVADPTSKPLGYRVVEFVPSIWDFASLVGIGGMCVWAFLRSRAKTEIIPIHDPRIAESLNYHE